MAADTYNKAYKFRIYPNEAQKILFAKTFGCVRFVYNHYLYIRKMAYETEKKSISYHTCAKDLPILKSKYEWLKEIDSMALQQSLKHLDTAFQKLFSWQKSWISEIQIKEKPSRFLYGQNPPKSTNEIDWSGFFHAQSLCIF